MESTQFEAELKARYSGFTITQLEQEFKDIVSIPNARTNIQALTKMSILMNEMDKRGISIPGKSNTSSNYSRVQEESGFNAGSAIFGIVLIIGGIALSANTGTIFYGAVLVGLAMLIKSFF